MVYYNLFFGVIVVFVFISERDADYQSTQAMLCLNHFSDLFCGT